MEAKAAFAEAKAAFPNLVAQYGVDNVVITWDKTPPGPQPGSGKFKHIIHVV